jgi:hypothetical protein
LLEPNEKREDVVEAVWVPEEVWLVELVEGLGWTLFREPERIATRGNEGRVKPCEGEVRPVVSSLAVRPPNTDSRMLLWPLTLVEALPLLI